MFISKEQKKLCLWNLWEGGFTEKSTRHSIRFLKAIFHKLTPPALHQCHSRKIKLTDLRFTRSGQSAAWILNSNQTPCFIADTDFNWRWKWGTRRQRLCKDNKKFFSEMCLILHLLQKIYSFITKSKVNETIVSKRERKEQMTYTKDVWMLKTAIDNKRKTIEEYSRVGQLRVLRLREGGKGCYFCTP